MAEKQLFTVVVSVGDCNGIGLEVFAKALKVLENRHNRENFLFKLAANTDTVEQYCRLLNISCVVVDNGVRIHGTYCEILPCAAQPHVVLGSVDPVAGALAWQSLEIAVQEVQKGKADAMLTLPVSKSTLKLAGYPFPGQTEFLAARCNIDKPLMILCTSAVRVGLVTIHIPLAQVAAAITKAKVIESLTAFYTSVKRDFGCEHPRIAVLGLNPHAGENGEIGTEENDVLLPALAECSAAGIIAEGPFPADGFFAHGAYKNYDGILAMYHDQGLIPLKLLAQGGGVNVTAGLPIIRTSPDHGTAYAIAGRNIADPASTVEAIEMAHQIAQARQHYARNPEGETYVL